MIEAKQYIGVTIGPIYDTLVLTSTPAGLWGASFLFSSIARELCDRFGKFMTLVSPYYHPEDTPFVDHLGIGLFPDHLIFERDEAALEDIEGIVVEVKEYAADLLCASGVHAEEPVKEYYREYLQIHVVAFASAGNPILDSSQALDAVELERSFPVVEKVNPILACLELPRTPLSRDVGGRNDAIKNSRMVRESIRSDAWQLLKPNGGIRELEDIAGSGVKIKDRPKGSNFKKYTYYAIVQSDGDNMTNMIEACKGDAGIRVFSKKCLEYVAEAAKAVKAYGGVTIYAGGDDLLFIAPVENEKGDNLFLLINKICGEFAKSFGEGEGTPTVSFGVAMCYYKFPLYEAFSIANKMLFGKAKRVLGKNALALTLQKHSGASLELGFPHLNDNGCLIRMVALLNNLPKEEVEEKHLSSAAFHLRQHEVLFAHAVHLWQCTGNTAILENVFNNTFDADMHSESGIREYLNGVFELMWEAHQCQTETEIPDHLNSEIKEALPRLRSMDGLLRLISFFLEKGREES